MKWRIQKLFEAGKPVKGKMLGYRLVNGKLQAVPAEAELVRQIFADYLGGMGALAIAKKLNAAGVPTSGGGPWKERTIITILANDKYTGDLILQKTFVRDHVTKKKCINRGELPRYQVANSHEPIISRELFAQVQQEKARRAAEWNSQDDDRAVYPFTHKILCEKCGVHFRRKHTAAGTKYEKVVWICGTFNTLGRSACDAQQIPERILCEKAAEVLGLSAFDESVFNAKIKEIRIPSPGKLIFVSHDGRHVEVSWENLSRRASWTPEMKHAAREHQRRVLDERKGEHD